MTKVQFFAPTDTSTAANFGNFQTGWAAQLSNAIVAVGWARVSDPNNVFPHRDVNGSFDNITTAMLTAITSTTNARIPVPAGNGRYQGAFDTTGATAYTGAGITDNTTVDFVTSAGVTYICMQTTQVIGNGTNGITSVSNPAGSQWQFNSANASFAFRAGDTIKITAGTVNPISANNQGTFTIAASPAPTASAFQVTAAFAGTVETKNGTITEATAPANDLFTGVTLTGLVGHWAIYCFEVFVQTDTAASTNPTYLKLTYNPITASGPTWEANISIIIGTSVVNTGTATNYMQITGNIFNSGVAAYETRFGFASVPTGVFFECDVSSESGGSLNFLMWRTNTVATCVVIDRSRDSNGAMTDLYVFVGTLGAASSSGTKSQVLMKQGTGAIVPPLIETAWPTIVMGTTSTVAFGGNVTASPLFPIVGWVGNPILAATAFKAADVVEGGILNVILYGTTHPYLIFKTNVGSAVWGTGSGAVGIRWE